MNYNRALHIDDYNHLAPWVNRLNEFEHYIGQQRVPYRKDHHHREWEYASCLQQLEQLGLPKSILIHDTGSGGSYFPPFLAKEGWNIEVSDSMDYGDPTTDFLIPQCTHLGVRIPIRKLAVEDMYEVKDETFGVSMCISVIEHVDPNSFLKALNELVRTTQKGGYIFITSDFFRDKEAWEKSPFKQIQHNVFYERNVEAIMSCIPVEFVGEKDFSYRGDFVNNYSFVNICLKRTS